MRTRIGSQLALVFLLALTVRLTAGWMWQSRLDGRFGFGDSESYWVLGRAIAEGEPYQYASKDARVFRSPGYPILLAPIFWIAGDEPSVMWARAESALFGTFSVGGVLWLGRLLFDWRAGLLAAAVAAVYPGAVAISALVLSEAPFTALMLGQLGLWIVAWKASSQRRSTASAFCGGLVGGLATLVRPSWLLFTPLALCVALVFGQERKRHMLHGTVMLLGLVLVMLPWWIRNAVVTGHFVPTTLQVGASLYDGLNPRADGSSDMGFIPRMARAERANPAAAGGEPSDPFEYRLDRRLRNAAISWARANPGGAVRLAGVKLVRMWNIWPNEPSLSGWPIRLALVLTYVPVLALAMVGAWRTWRRGWPYMLCWLPAVYFTLLHMVFVSSIRYRQPAMLPLIVLGVGVASHWRRLDETRCPTGT